MLIKLNSHVHVTRPSQHYPLARSRIEGFSHADLHEYELAQRIASIATLNAGSGQVAHQATGKHKLKYPSNAFRLPRLI